MKKVFAMFDQGKTGFVECSKFVNILNTLGQAFDEDELKNRIAENDPNSKFCCYCLNSSSSLSPVLFLASSSLSNSEFALLLNVSITCQTKQDSVNLIFSSFRNAEEGKVDFEKFCAIVMPFLEEDDDEAMHEELKEAFRLYDKGGE